MPLKSKDYTKLKVAQLQNELKKRGLETTGVKAVLIDRLRENDGADDTATEEIGSGDTSTDVVAADNNDDDDMNDMEADESTVTGNGIAEQSEEMEPAADELSKDSSVAEDVESTSLVQSDGNGEVSSSKPGDSEVPISSEGVGEDNAVQEGLEVQDVESTVTDQDNHLDVTEEQRPGEAETIGQESEAAHVESDTAVDSTPIAEDSTKEQIDVHDDSQTETSVTEDKPDDAVLPMEAETIAASLVQDSSESASKEDMDAMQTEKEAVATAESIETVDKTEETKKTLMEREAVVTSEPVENLVKSADIEEKTEEAPMETEVVESKPDEKMEADTIDEKTEEEPVETEVVETSEAVEKLDKKEKPDKDKESLSDQSIEISSATTSEKEAKSPSVAESKKNEAAVTDSKKKTDKVEVTVVEVNPEEGIKRREERDKRLAENKHLTELDKFWKAVIDNPTDFTGWTYLLQYVEQSSNLPDCREAFDLFLAKYPYCFGYWKKYADIEKKHKYYETAEEVFQKGLKDIHMSIDLWMHYVNFFKDRHYKDDDFVDKMRELYDRAVSTAGEEYKSDRLWESYISWEKELNNIRNITNVYDRVLAIPTQFLNTNFTRFQTHVNSNDPRDLLTTDEFLSLRRLINEGKDEGTDASPDTPPEGTAGEGDEAPPGIDEPPGTDGQESKTGEAKSKTSETEVAELRRKIIEIRKTIFDKTSAEQSERKVYEEHIKRPYFHVKPLERAQLNNWKSYLDFEISQGNHKKTIILFERCVIACALYEDLWLKYAKYMEERDAESARDVYRRACTIHLPKKISINLAWSIFEEKLGNYEVAAEILSNLHERMPGMLVIALRRISLERRFKHHDKALALLNDFLSEASSPDLKMLFVVRLSRYHMKILNDPMKAQEVIVKTLDEGNTNVRLYMQLLDIAYQSNPVDESLALSTFERVLKDGSISKDDKLRFSQRRIEFVEDFGADISVIVGFTEDHKTLDKSAAEAVSSKKRGSSPSPDANSKKKKVKSVATVPAATTSYQTSYSATPPSQPVAQSAYASPQQYTAPPPSMYGAATAQQQPYTAPYGQTWPGYNQMGYDYSQNWSGYNYYGQQ